MAGVQLSPVEEEPGEHHGARDGDHGADHEALNGGPAEERAGAEPQQDGEQDSQRSSDQGHPLHAQEVAKRELDPDREHQSEGADEDATQDVAEDQWLAGEPRQRPAEQRGGEHVGEIAEDEGVGDHDVTGRVGARSRPVYRGCGGARARS